MNKVEFSVGNIVTYRNEHTTLSCMVVDINVNPMTDQIEYKLVSVPGPDKPRVKVITTGISIMESELFPKGDYV